jgi:hypothetical protein
MADRVGVLGVTWVGGERQPDRVGVGELQQRVEVHVVAAAWAGTFLLPLAQQ